VLFEKYIAYRQHERMPWTAPSAMGTTATIVATADGSRPVRELPGEMSSMRIGVPNKKAM